MALNVAGRLLLVMAIGMYFEPTKAKAPMASASVKDARRKEVFLLKARAAAVPNAAAIIAEPLPPRLGIAHTMSKQPAAAPTRSKAYNRLMRHEMRVNNKEMISPEIKKGAEIVM